MRTTRRRSCRSRRRTRGAGGVGGPAWRLAHVRAAAARRRLVRLRGQRGGRSWRRSRTPLTLEPDGGGGGPVGAAAGPSSGGGGGGGAHTLEGVEGLVGSWGAACRAAARRRRVGRGAAAAGRAAPAWLRQQEASEPTAGAGRARGAAGARRLGGWLRRPPRVAWVGRWAATRAASRAGWQRNGLQAAPVPSGACAPLRDSRRWRAGRGGGRRGGRRRAPHRRRALGAAARRGGAGGAGSSKRSGASRRRRKRLPPLRRRTRGAPPATRTTLPAAPSLAPGGRRRRRGRRRTGRAAEGVAPRRRRERPRHDGAERLNVYVGEWATGREHGVGCELRGWRRAGPPPPAAVCSSAAAAGSRASATAGAFVDVGGAFAYRGEWLGGKPHGEGSACWTLGRGAETYEGSWAGRARRFGCCVRADGEQYGGEWGGGRGRWPQRRGRRRHALAVGGRPARRRWG